MKFFFVVTAMLAIAGCASVAPIPEPAPEPVPEIRPGILQGYLAREDSPDSLALLPPPPAEGSSAFQLDREINKRLLTLHDTPRFELAAKDNNLHFPEAAETFSCALDTRITETDTPYLYQLLRRTLADAGLATYGAKLHYKRGRPFLENGAPNCAAESEQAMLKDDPSYPSGHTAIGWAWALILAELAPDRADAILKRGLAFGESRAVCNVHWPSDVVAGRTIGAAAVSILHADQTFQQDLEIAGKELAAARARGVGPSQDCVHEAAALAVQAGGSD